MKLHRSWLVACGVAATISAAPAGTPNVAVVAPKVVEQPALPTAPVIAANAASFELSNGLKVVVIPDNRAPVVTHMVWYRVGSADEPAGKSGIAHYLEHLMFKGTANYPAGAFSKIVAEIGGQENAFTSSDYTSYYQRVAKEHLALVMRLEADRMEGLILTEATARPELNVVLEERSQRVDNDPAAQFGEAMDAALYVSSPYRIPIIGWRHEIEKLTYRDALDFYNKWYTPNNAVLVIAGDVTADEVRRLAEETYGKVKRRFEVEDRRRPTEPEPLARREVTFADERVTEPSLRLTWLTPSARTAKPGESEALDLLCEALGGGSSSILYRDLVVATGMASSVGCHYNPMSYDDTRMVIYGVPAGSASLAELRAALLDRVKAVIASGVSPEDLLRAKRRLVSSAVHAQDNQSSLARLFGTALTVGATVEAVQNWPARVYATPAPALAKAAETYLQDERMVAGNLVSAPPSGKAKTARGGVWPPMGVGGAAIRYAEPVGNEDVSEAAE